MKYMWNNIRSEKNKIRKNNGKKSIQCRSKVKKQLPKKMGEQGKKNKATCKEKDMKTEKMRTPSFLKNFIFEVLRLVFCLAVSLF